MVHSPPDFFELDCTRFSTRIFAHPAQSLRLKACPAKRCAVCACTWNATSKARDETTGSRAHVSTLRSDRKRERPQPFSQADPRTQPIARTTGTSGRRRAKRRTASPEQHRLSASQKYLRADFRGRCVIVVSVDR